MNTLTDEERFVLKHFKDDWEAGFFRRRSLDEALAWERDNHKQEMRPDVAVEYERIRLAVAA